MLTPDMKPGRPARTARVVAALWFLTAGVGGLPGLFLAQFAEDACPWP